MSTTKDFKLLGADSDKDPFYATFNDIDLSTYDIKLITGNEKIIQQVIKFILTQKGSLPLFPQYGTNIYKMLNHKYIDMSLEDIKNEIIYGVKWVKDTNVNDDINIKDIVNIGVQLINTTELNVRLTLSLTNGETLQLNQNVVF